jgi:hypothetical protein
MARTRRFNGRSSDRGTMGEPIVDNALGIVGESRGLIGNIARLGLGLFFAPKKVAQGRHAGPRAANVIPFPASGRSSRLKCTGVK